LNQQSNHILKNSSLRIQIGLLYTILAFVNIVFFSVMIFENQSDLLVRSFKFQSENLVHLIQNELIAVSFDEKKTQDWENFRNRLKLYEINSYTIYDSNGKIINQYPETNPILLPTEQKKIISKISEVGMSGSGSLFKSRYKLELNQEDFSVWALIPFTNKSNRESYLETRITLSSIQDRLNQIYIFMAVATTWGIVFHILFAIFIYRVIFQRLGILQETSEKMSKGDLSSRAIWKSKRQDELDILGESFNSMADKIEETIKTVTRLNSEINLELTIGKEVQELFLPKMKLFQSFSIGKLFRPMREVSGDIYQMFKLEKDNQLYYCFFIADASGHGVSASLVTVVISIFLESILKETSEPDLVIQKLSNLMGNRLQSSFFATAVFLRISSSNSIDICNGGHNIPLIIKKNSKDFIEINSSGPPLGMAEDHNYKSEHFFLNSGDQIFLYTDGLVESTGKENIQYGLDKVKTALLSQKEKSNQEFVDEISKDLELYTSEFKDDVTILLLEIPK
jgi:sigma-B regulation protein RsbU (phosphoserine phosphatase)